ALIAMAAILFERAQEATPRTARFDAASWARVVGCTLAAAAMVAYFNGLRVTPVHRHDQFHYVMGANNFPELGYQRLDLCPLVAQSQLRTVLRPARAGRLEAVNLAQEAQSPTRTIRY